MIPSLFMYLGLCCKDCLLTKLCSVLSQFTTSPGDACIWCSELKYTPFTYSLLFVVAILISSHMQGILRNKLPYQTPQSSLSGCQTTLNGLVLLSLPLRTISIILLSRMIVVIIPQRIIQIALPFGIIIVISFPAMLIYFLFPIRILLLENRIIFSSQMLITVLL